MSLFQIINYSIVSYIEAFNLGFDTNISILSFVFASIAPFFLLLIIAIVLWVFTNRILKYLLPEDLDNTSESKINLDDIQYIAFSIIGILILTNALPQIFNLIPNIIRYNEISSHLHTPQFKTEVIFSIVENVAKLIIGFILIFGSKGLTGLLKKIRELGAR